MPYDPNDPPGKTIAAMFEAVAEEHLIQPTILYDFPVAISPLSKNKRDEADWVERFEVFVGGLGGGKDGSSSKFGESEDYQVSLGWRIGPGGLLDRGRIRAGHRVVAGPRDLQNGRQQRAIRSGAHALAAAGIGSFTR